MQFVVVARESELPVDYEGAVLIPDNWNDYNFLTTFELSIKHRAKNTNNIGYLKIAHVDMGMPQDFEVRRTTERLPQQFEALDEKFFSLSLRDTYYENLNALDASTAAAILKSLRDIAYDDSGSILSQVQNLPVYQRSVIRDVAHPAAELERLRLISRGRDRVVDFQWHYELPRSNESDLRPLTLDFSANPGSLPSTNVHALIGRNGVGKTRLMHAMAYGMSIGAIKFTQSATHVAQVRPNVVMVSFSAFDDLFQAAANSPGFSYVGLRRSGNPQRLKTSEELSAEFADSLSVARAEPRRTRWYRLLKILRYPESGLLDDFAGSLESLLSDRFDDRFKATAAELFRPLSSGHKIALLTLTRLIEEVTERTVVFMDEPEAHLQPPLLSAFVRALSEFLTDVNGMAVLATHSPVVLQEVPRSCVYKLRRYGEILTADRPRMETYGENVSELTYEAFGLEVTATGFYAALVKQVADGRSYQEILNDFDSLGGEARGLLRALTLHRGTAAT